MAKALPGSLVLMEGQSSSSVPPTFSRAFAVDRGSEYKGAFKENVEKRGATLRISARRRLRQNAKAEANVKRVQKLTTAALLQSSRPASLWSLAMDVALHNDAHSRVVRDEKTAFELRWKRPPRGTLYPFGCEIWALRDTEDRDKYESRGERSIFVAYEGEESVSYLRF